MSKTELVSLECKSCGGMMQYKKGDPIATCPYCGSSVLIDRKEDRPIGQDYSNYGEKKNAKREKRAKLIIAAVVLSIFALFALIRFIGYKSSVITTDPFQNVTVEFSGKSGRGSAKVQNNGGGDLARIRFALDKSGNLKNGDEITLTAQKISGYNWSRNEKTYTVSGLLETIKKPSELNQEEIVAFHEISELNIDRSWEKVTTGGNSVKWEREPYKLFILVADNEKQNCDNILYDTYKTTVTTESGKELTFFQAVGYTNVYRKGNGAILADYSNVDLKSWGLGYDFGFDAWCAIYGWQTATEMERELLSNAGYSKGE